MKKAPEEQATLDAAAVGLKSALAKGWEVVRVADLAKNEPRSITDGPFGSNLKTEHYTDGGPRVVRLQNIGDGEFTDGAAHVSREHFERLRNHEARSGDVAIAMLGEGLPRACLIPATLGPAIVKADCARLRVAEDLSNPRFVMFALNAPQTRQAASKLIHGLGRPRLGLGLLKELPVPIGPRAEQDRVVEVLDSYLTRLNAAAEGLTRVEANLKRYRASVLKAAVEGRLVPTEADLARKEGRDYEPASAALARILNERRRRWEDAELARLKARGERVDGAKWRTRYEEPAPADVADLRDLPVGWSWATIDQISTVSGGVTKNAGREGTSRSLPYLRVANVYANELRLGDIQEIAISDAEYERVLLRRGDVLVVEGNGSLEQIGRVAMWDGAISPCVHQNHIIKVRPLDVDPTLAARWILTWLMSPGGRSVITSAASSTSGLHTLSLSKIGRMVIPLPPEDEQRRIMDAVEAATSGLDVVSGSAARSGRRITRLRQAVLKWAFEGKLVDQDPNDEPVSMLLHRIRQTFSDRTSDSKRPLRAPARKTA